MTMKSYCHELSCSCTGLQKPRIRPICAGFTERLEIYWKEDFVPKHPIPKVSLLTRNANKFSDVSNSNQTLSLKTIDCWKKWQILSHTGNVLCFNVEASCIHWPLLPTGHPEIHWKLCSLQAIQSPHDPLWIAPSTLALSNHAATVVHVVWSS